MHELDVTNKSNKKLEDSLDKGLEFSFSDGKDAYNITGLSREFLDASTNTLDIK